MSRTARPESYTAIRVKIGERIGWVRELVMPNRTEAAETLGMDPSTLAKIESGDRTPSVYQIIEFANRFRVSTDFILREMLTARTDEELALKLAALHPEVVLQPESTETGTDKALASGKRQRPKTRAPVG